MKLLRKLSVDRMTTTGLILLTGLTWLGQEVLERESLPIDTPLLLQIHQWANPVLDQVMLGITRLADPEVVVVVVAIALGWLVQRRQWRSAVMLLFACLGTLIINQAMKLMFARPRPLLWPRLIEETSYGFPVVMPWVRSCYTVSWLICWCDVIRGRCDRSMALRQV
jgi:hypothetical protein